MSGRRAAPAAMAACVGRAAAPVLGPVVPAAVSEMEKPETVTVESKLGWGSTVGTCEICGEMGGAAVALPMTADVESTVVCAWVSKRCINRASK